MASGAGQRYELIVERLAKVQGGEEIRDILERGETPRCFWATAPTGRPHIAYFVPLIKIAEFVKANIDVTVLFCDLYAFLVNYKHSLELVTWRTKYYRHTIAAMLDLLGVPQDKVRFVDGSSYELTKEFSIDNYRLCTLVDESDARETGDEYRNARKISVLLCPGLPALAEEYLHADFQFGGEDQDGLFAFNERFLPQLGFRKRAHMMNAMIPGLSGPKMSSSIPDSKIGLLDDAEEVFRKVSMASCEDMVVSGNGLLAIVKEILMPISRIGVDLSHRNGSKVNSHLCFCSRGAPVKALFTIATGGSIGEMRHFESYSDLEQEVVSGRLSAHDLKLAVAQAINRLLDPLRKMYEGNSDWQMTDRFAYSKEQ